MSTETKKQKKASSKAGKNQKGTKRGKDEAPAGEPAAKRAKKGGSTKPKGKAKAKATKPKSKAKAKPKAKASDTEETKEKEDEEEKEKDDGISPQTKEAFSLVWAQLPGKRSGICDICDKWADAVYDKSLQGSTCRDCFFGPPVDSDSKDCVVCDASNAGHTPAECPRVMAEMMRVAKESSVPTLGDDAKCQPCWKCKTAPLDCKCPWNQAVSKEQTLGAYLDAVLSMDAENRASGQWSAWCAMIKAVKKLTAEQKDSTVWGLKHTDHEPVSKDETWACSLCGGAVVKNGYCSGCDIGGTKAHKCRICTRALAGCKCDWRRSGSPVSGLALLWDRFLDHDGIWQDHDRFFCVLDAMRAKTAALAAVMMMAVLGANGALQIELLRRECARADQKKDKNFYNQLSDVFEIIRANADAAVLTDEFKRAAEAVAAGKPLPPKEGGGKHKRYFFDDSDDEDPIPCDDSDEEKKDKSEA